MAADCVVDGNYLGEYSRFFAEFVARVNPDDQLPVKVSAYDINESELVGEIISVTLQYLNQTYCPPSLQSYIVYLVIQAIKSTCKKQPEICGLRQKEKTYAPLKLMQAVTNEVNEICRRYLDNSRLALLPPPSSTPQVTVGATRNARRKMEDRHIVLHDLHTIFNIQDDMIANYYAVFDGHGGQDAAVYCATHLHQYLAESVHYPTDPERALRDAFLTTDAQFIAKSNTQKLSGGTTVVCALVLNKKLYIAWVGDSMASLVSRGNVRQLVNPHRPTREDESERIHNMGGVVVHCMGVLRVNGFLSISRAIGDVSYKPYISGEPEVRCISLDGTEDFLIIACDGLWDYVDPRTAALRVYKQVLQNPHDLKYVHQALLQSAKRAGSLDNITVIVVFLTPPIEIASRHSLLTHQVPNGLLLNNMDPRNSLSSYTDRSELPDQSDDDSPFVKRPTQHIMNANIQHINRVVYETTTNGKHQDNDGKDDDYDDTDLGPETDVDAGEDATDDVPYSTSHEFSPENVKSMIKTEEHSNDSNDNNSDDLLNCDNANICPVSPIVDDDNVDNRVRPNDAVRDAGDEMLDNNDDDTHVQSPRMHIVEDDEPSSWPQADKPLQHALIPETENVADSEDSEDEWNYYRIDSSKEETAVAAATSNESYKSGEEQKSVQENLEFVAKDSSEIQFPTVENDIKCEELEADTSPELVNIDISDESSKLSKSETSHAHVDEEEKQEEINKGDMDFQLNPEAAEFVPLSPPLLGNKNVLQDYLISGSPLKQTPAMDDIPIPSQSEFEKEVCQRPREIDEKNYSSDEQNTDHIADLQDNNHVQDMDVSEISMTKVELGDDESMAVNVSTTQWQTDISSQWSEKARDDSGSDLEECVIAKNDPMTMSFTPGDLEAAFDKSVDLNAVHELNDSSDGAEHASTPPRSPETYASEERTHTPFLDDKGLNDLLCASSTPQPTDEKLTCSIIPESDKVKYSFLTSNIENLPAELEISPLRDFLSMKHTTQEDSNTFDEVKFPTEKEYNHESLFHSPGDKDFVLSERIANEDVSKVPLEMNEDLINNDDLQLKSQSETHDNESFEFNCTESSFTEKPTMVVCEKDIELMDDFNEGHNKPGQMKLNEKSAFMDELGVSPLMDDLPTGHINQENWSHNVRYQHQGPLFHFSGDKDFVLPSKNEDLIDNNDLQPKIQSETDNNELLLLSKPETPELNFSLPEKSTQEICGENTELMGDFDEGRNEGEQTELLCGNDESSQFIVQPSVQDTLSCISSEREEQKSLELLSKPIQEDSDADADSLLNSEHSSVMQNLPSNLLDNSKLLNLNLMEPSLAQGAQSDMELKFGTYPEAVDTIIEPTFTVENSYESKLMTFREENNLPQDTSCVKDYAYPIKMERTDVTELNEIETRTEKEHEFEENYKNDDHSVADLIKTVPADISNSELFNLETNKQNRLEKEATENILTNINEMPELEPSHCIRNEIISISPNEEEIKPQEKAEILPEEITMVDESKEQVTEVTKIDESKEQIMEVAEVDKLKEQAMEIAEVEKVKDQVVKAMVVETVVATAVAATAATATTATTATTALVTAVSPIKAKTTTTAKRPTKTTTTTKASTPATKTPTKSTPTSPSKAVSTATRTATSLTTQTVAAKKPTTARPKQLDGFTKSTISNAGGKSTVTKTTTMTSKTATTATKSLPRVNAGTTKPKTATSSATSLKPSVGASTEKKSITSCDVKPITKSVAAKPANATSKTSISGTATKSTLVKSSSTTAKSSPLSVTSKPRPTSAVRISPTTTKQLAAGISGATTGIARPKTAPSSVGTNKPRESISKTTTAKSSLINKQSKETVNKQISSGASLTSKTTGRTSVNATTGTANTIAKSRTSSGKSTVPLKKSALTSKVTTKVSSKTKSAPSTEAKVVQNGILENKIDVTKTTVITTNDKSEEDVPRKDVSPLDVPIDNQLIAD